MRARVSSGRSGQLAAAGAALALAFAACGSQRSDSAGAADGFAAPASAAQIDRCRAVLDRQAAAWNRGDVGAFANGYWVSPQLVFASQSGVTVGHEPMVQRYRRRFPDRKAMGRLAFSELAFRALSSTELLASGRWRLTRERDAPGGRFLLVMRDVAGQGCRIALDYTTSD